MTQTRSGACHCGAIRYTATGEPQHHALCHRTGCYRWSGAHIMVKDRVGWIDDIDMLPPLCHLSRHGLTAAA